MRATLSIETLHSRSTGLRYVRSIPQKFVCVASPKFEHRPQISCPSKLRGPVHPLLVSIKNYAGKRTIAVRHILEVIAQSLAHGVPGDAAVRSCRCRPQVARRRYGNDSDA